MARMVMETDGGWAARRQYGGNIAWLECGDCGEQGEPVVFADGGMADAADELLGSAVGPDCPWCASLAVA